MTTTSIAMTKNVMTPPAHDDEREQTIGKPAPVSADASRRSSDTSTEASAKVEGAEGEALAKPPSLPLDLKAHSDELLWLIIAGAQSELQERKTKREADFIEQVKEGARQLSIPYERLAARLGVKSARPTALRPASALPEEGREGNRADGRSVVKPKYRNPADPSQTWSGRGAAPQWVADRLAAGGKKEDLAIPRDEE